MPLPARLSRPRRWLALATLLGVPCLGAAPPPSPASQAAAPADRAADSPTAAIEKKLPELIGVVEEYTGLRFKRPVPVRAISSAALGEKLASRLQPDDLKPLEISFKAFGLIPESTDLSDAYVRLMAEQFAGLYDWRDKDLYLVTGPESLFDDALARRHGAVLAGRMQEMLAIHELTHAIQDQHFDLAKLKLGDSLSDTAMARLALVEGYATLVALADLASVPPDKISRVSPLLLHMLHHPEQAPPMTPGMAEPTGAPQWLGETTHFTYLQGASFCLEVLERGGQRLLDHAFTADPPRSTEQILHPEKWFDRRDDPVVIAWPDLRAVLPGYAKAAEGQLGELGIKIWLKQHLQDPRRAEAAAAGWGGDRFAVYRRAALPAAGAASRAPARGGDSAGTAGQSAATTLLAWITDWDTDQDAARLAAAAGALGAGWSVERTAARRVVVLRGTLSAAERTALVAKLAAAPATAAANQAVAAAAIDESRKTGAAGPVTAARLAARGGQFEPLQPLSKGRLSEDGRTYTFPEVGLSVRLPSAFATWRAKSLEGSTALLFLTDPQGDSLTVTAIDLHRSNFPLELFEHLVEQRMELNLPGFAKLDAHVVETGGQPAYELRFSYARSARFQGVQRIILRGIQLLSVSIDIREDRWAEAEASARELLAGVTVAPPAPPAGPAGDTAARPGGTSASPEDAAARPKDAEAEEGDSRAWQVRRPREAPRSSLEFRLVVERDEPGPAPGSDPAHPTLELPGPDGTPLILSSEAVATQADITKAEVAPGMRPDEYVVYVHLTPDAARRLRRVSGDNVGRRLAIVIDGRIFMAPYMHSAVDSPVMIEGALTREAATRIAERLAP